MKGFAAFVRCALVLPVLSRSAITAFTIQPCNTHTLTRPVLTVFYGRFAASNSASDNEEESRRAKGELDNLKEWTPEQVEKTGNLVADDEWLGLSMELSELVRVAVIEHVKKGTSDFLDKEDYKIGDVLKEIDTRVKSEVAKLRGKDEYEIGDLSIALDKISKDAVCNFTGKENYKFGDLSTELDVRIKSSVAEFCGTDEYQFGDLTKEIDRRVKQRVVAFVGKEYEFGDISLEIETRRRQWVTDFLGKEAAEAYEFGDITKKALKKFTGKDEYQFGDVSKKIFGDLFRKRKRGGQ